MPKPVMVYTANDLHGSKDFLKGLRDLLLERDNTSACEIRTKLEAMDYNREVNFSMSSVLKFSSKEAKMLEFETTSANRSLFQTLDIKDNKDGSYNCIMMLVLFQTRNHLHELRSRSKSFRIKAFVIGFVVLFC
ncbi:Two-component response regulator-like, partial [Stylosanthes scabra]|nr:Two-component response regulator-like [Stylosanthes scabra]